MRYRKKPVEINAWEVSVLLEDAATDWMALPKPVRDCYEAGKLLFLPNAIEIQTLEGWMKGGRDDMLICGVVGELYACKPDIFAATYEVAA